jgi:hypothetical protein
MGWEIHLECMSCDTVRYDYVEQEEARGKSW